MAKNYYDMLGVQKNASPDEIKRAFRKLAHQHHPDKPGGDENKFKEINEAYQVLSNPEKKQQYDQFGTTFEQAQSHGGFGGFDGFRDFSGFANGFNINMDDLGDMFSGFSDVFGFGGGARTKSRARKGQDIAIDLELEFKEAIFGAEKIINLQKHVACGRCQGKGGEPNSKITTCPTCRGAGQVRTARQTILGTIATTSVCPQCGGEGKRYEKICGQCGGNGIVRDKKQIKINIPAGINDNETIRLSGEGEAGVKGGRAGDLFVTARVKDSPDFERQGYDIYTLVPISFTQAALGAKIEVKTLEGAVKLKIPEGTQTGKVFRLRGQGVPHLKQMGRGDHLVEVIVRTPERLSRGQRKLLEELGE